MQIDEATERDIPALTAIYNEVIASSTAVFSEQPVSADSRLRWLEAHRIASQPVIVARVSGEVAGFAAYGDFRAWPGYSSTVEHSLHVARSHRRRGVGRGLLEQLIDCARLDGLHAMVAGIDAENEASLRLHEQLGFEGVGRMPEIARKFDRWVDLVLLQLIL